MDFQRMYRDKLATVDQVLDLLKSGDEIVVGVGPSESVALLEKLHTIWERVENVTVLSCLPMGPYEFCTNPKYKAHFFHESWFFTGPARMARDAGMASYVPGHLSLVGKRRLGFTKPRVVFAVASPMDRWGNLSLSLGVSYTKDFMEHADLVVVEVSPNFPVNYGDTLVNIRDVDYVVETERHPPELPIAPFSEKALTIGQYIAELVEDGSTIQLGIGAIPNAVAHALKDKKDLGVHTEMFTDSMVDLYEAGVITGAKKTIHHGKMIATFAYGTRRLYDFLDGNPMCEFYRSGYVNNPVVVGQNYKMVSINTSLQVDVTGQCCSESLGTKHYSGTGGQTDTAVGAQLSEGGKSIIALYSTVKDDTISTIVPALTRGAPVTLTRMDVDYVVTEQGVAPLRGRSIRDRVKNLIAVAHPKFREELREEVKRLGIC
ncbi:MAG: acetyl-CoA hydrolase/transferase family protein [Bacillota bacterium]|nr:acetyl-CoA hydrolase/transferase family protein [Candidatus Fermentithermobacillaceae bacterium]